MFRQQASMIARKKESTAERLSQLMQEATKVHASVQEKEETLRQMPKVGSPIMCIYYLYYCYYLYNYY